MKILLIGGNGTIGKKVAASFSLRHELIIAGKTSGDIQVDIASENSIKLMFEKVRTIDACVCMAGTGYYGPFDVMTSEDMMDGVKGKLLGQTNVVLIGKEYLSEGGSFTLTSGIAAEHPARNGTCVAMINGGVNSFVLAAAQELKKDKRINAVSPGWLKTAGSDMDHYFLDITWSPCKN
jgi:NAD(P)-dependent dehydrogenase (short-subunit alcohol dehydrogenase family)